MMAHPNSAAESTSPTAKPLPAKPLPFRRLWIPLIIQGALILAIPAPAIYTALTGQTVILKTRPVDPYDLFRGYSQTLSYSISDTQALAQLSGWDTILQDIATDPKHLPRGSQLYVILEAPSNLDRMPPQAWKPVQVSLNRPESLPKNRIALKGKIEGAGWLKYGLETYYVPENRREEVNQAISQIQRSQQSFVVEVKVDNHGHAILKSLWVGDKNYRF